ncbi:MAG TPA: type 1 glutamine amidotransferase [Candidatus Acidoferrum sp.]|jgi:GMP synthase-like glutamine amidotransferase|nr:type 1 glutamine amidotransferase [Candidatus Acidoferrum sp.]
MGASKLKALIVQHEEPTPAGLLAEWLDLQSAQIDVLRIDLDERVPDPREFQLIAYLGSEFASFDDSVPFVDRESELIRQAAQHDVPMLGLCFGSQLMARALGGKSFRAERPEIGWFRVRSNDSDLISEGPWFEWHYDSFTLPAGARLLAETDVGPQAYVIGRSLGLQFHPEVTPDILDGWVSGHLDSGGDVGGIDLEAMLDEAQTRAPALRLATLQLFDRFLERVARLGAGSVSIDGASHT